MDGDQYQIDYKNPDYTAIFADRARRLERLNKDPRLVDACKVHYASHPWDFVADWGMTMDPRNLDRGLLVAVPFIPFPKQVEFLQWLYWAWENRQRGLCEKSRDCGVTWLAVGFAANMWLFRDGFHTGFGSQKEEKVDKKGDPDCIFEKLRFFVDYVPSIFRPIGFTDRLHSSHMKLVNPANGNSITGEVGDAIGRGGRKSVFFVDEAAHIEHQDLVDKALSQTTNCQIDLSSVNGSGNAFYRKRQRWDGTRKVFIFDWRDDPRKSQAWYDALFEDFDESTIAQEVDRDYEASNEDAFIPAKWLRACVDAHLVLDFEPEGMKTAGFDPADTGDAKAVVLRHGSVIVDAEEMKSGDITQAIPWAAHKADKFGAEVFGYDAEGMGAPTIKLVAERVFGRRATLIPYYAGGAVELPEALYTKNRKNKDAFLNYKAQSWTWMRDRVHRTYVAITRAKKGQVVTMDPDKMLSISSECTHRENLITELSRPKRIFKTNGKIVVESKKEMKARGVDSPNLAEAAIVAFSLKQAPAEALGPIVAEDFVVHDPGMSY